MYFKYKIQKYIYVFSILKILYKIQNGTMASNVFQTPCPETTADTRSRKNSHTTELGSDVDFCYSGLL